MSEEPIKEPIVEPSGNEPVTKPASTEPEPVDKKQRRKIAAAAVKDFKESEEFKSLIQSQVAEEVRQSQLSAKEKAEEERKKQEQSTKRELEEARKATAEANAVKELAKRGLPITFAATLAAADEETVSANIDNFQAEFDEAVKAKVSQATAGKSTPATGGNGYQRPKGKKIAEMTFDERMAYRSSDPEGYDKQYSDEKI